MSRLVRMGKMTAQAGREGLADYDDWLASAANRIEVGGADVRAAATFVRRFDLMLRTPDALHLAICRRLEADLVTLDRRLALAAEALDINVADISP